MSALWTELLRWLGAGGMAGVVGYIVSRPKTLGEAKQAAGAGVKSEAEARNLVDEGLWRRANDAADRAERARELAQRSEEICLHEKRSVVLAFDQFINDVEEILAEPDAETRARMARAAISRAREAI